MIRRFWNYWGGFIVVMGFLFIAYAASAEESQCVNIEDYNAAKIAATKAAKGGPRPTIQICNPQELIIKFDITAPKS